MKKNIMEQLGIEHFKIPRTKRNWFFIGFLVGYMPYIIHMEGWLK